MAGPVVAGSSNSTSTMTAKPDTASQKHARSKMGSITVAAGQTAPAANTGFPLWDRSFAPLEMSSVERRGQPLVGREPPKRSRPFGLEEAPTYRPTEEDWKNPIEYIQKIAPEAQQYGICKIVPPDSWNPDFAINTTSFHFRTRKIELSSVEGGARVNNNYVDGLIKFHRSNGVNFNRAPSVDKRPLDLYKLRRAVETRGGFERVCKCKRWAEIGRDLGYSGKIMSSLSTSLKNSYAKWLLPYEEYLRVAKPGVQQQLELENGGPLTPSPGPSPMKKSHQHTPSNLRDETPAIRASEALNDSIRNDDVHVESEQPTPVAEPPRPTPTPSFTPVNVGGFTPVNAAQVSSSGFTPVNAPNGLHRPAENGTSTPKRESEVPTSTTTSVLDIRPAFKRQSSDSSGRKSKRLKQDVTAPVAGSRVIQPRLIPRDRGSDWKPGDACDSCGKAEDQDKIVVCESCDSGYHIHCVEPPLRGRSDEWHCPRCLVGTGEFGFEEGGVYSLGQFQEKAAMFKESHFREKMPYDPILNCKRPITEDDVEREFWRLAKGPDEGVEVEYGADIHSTTHGSGFPTIERNPRDPYSTDPWNLNVLPFHQESLFRHIKKDISGMTVPWLYVGMVFSCFCWHAEDHWTYSANYQHFGATKTWYGIPSDEEEKFEEAMRKEFPELFETQPDLLFQLVTLHNPEKLRRAGVKVYALDQRAGQMVITFPRAFHAGFNHGFNFNEAVNFAPSDWEPFGEACVQQYQMYRRDACFSHDELLLQAAASNVTIKTAKWLAPALERMLDRELAARATFFENSQAAEKAGLDVNLQNGSDSNHMTHIEIVNEEQDPRDDDFICVFCKAHAYLSRFTCENTGKILCLLHAGTFECCDAGEKERFTGGGDSRLRPNGQPSHKLHFRLNEATIRQSVNKVTDISKKPQQWTEKLNKLLEEDARPSLKSLQALLREGEKIPYDLPELPDLKQYVERCNEWVEEATSFSLRKQQNRGKNNGKGLRKSTAKAVELEERERELRNVGNLKRLLAAADDIGFDCPEIQQMRERAEAIEQFQDQARTALLQYKELQIGDLEEVLTLGKSFGVDIPEVDRLDSVVQRLKWRERARDLRAPSRVPTLVEVNEILNTAEKLKVPEHDEDFAHFRETKQQGEIWEAKAKELMAVENVHFAQLDALSKQAASMPVSPETLAQVDAILKKQREAQDKIINIYQRTKEVELRNRPKYKEVRDIFEVIQELNSKPPGTLDLERELKRHEDWMRRGKKLFGKANAPLHILLQHMQIVESRNEACFDLNDQPRMPVEPSSREHTPQGSQHEDGTLSSREVFCICRRSEAGMMIECELCHEWYHGKCLKIARGKVKEDDKYTCPICDHRKKIPRDAARPKLEDLQGWQEEIPDLPFQPEEEDCLEQICDHAQAFRDRMRQYINPQLPTTFDEVANFRFFLRKIEGADILLAFETNYLRQELHKWAPVAPEAPPIIEISQSTRKPRPTKQQKLMAQYGVNTPEELPAHLRPKRKSEGAIKNQQPLQPAAEYEQLGTSQPAAPGPPTTPAAPPAPMEPQQPLSEERKSPPATVLDPALMDPALRNVDPALSTPYEPGALPQPDSPPMFGAYANDVDDSIFADFTTDA
ncbi:MAG: hypothetical protein M1820_009920 [Bogoriella megaspora]|nr:MAG: hypothetical protein M1820_009920 [Bogoriella megaspora]